MILKGHGAYEQRYYKKLFFSMDFVEFKVQLPLFAMSTI